MSADGGIRVGFVSTFDAATGMASIYYPDRNGQTTDVLPVLAPFGIRQTLNKGDAVIVMHLSDNKGAGFVLGTYSVKGDVPVASISVSGGNMTLQDASGSTTLGTVISGLCKC